MKKTFSQKQNKNNKRKIVQKLSWMKKIAFS